MNALSAQRPATGWLMNYTDFERVLAALGAAAGIIHLILALAH